MVYTQDGAYFYAREFVLRQLGGVPKTKNIKDMKSYIKTNFIDKVSKEYKVRLGALKEETSRSRYKVPDQKIVYVDGRGKLVIICHICS